MPFPLDSSPQKIVARVEGSCHSKLEAIDVDSRILPLPELVNDVLVYLFSQSNVVEESREGG